MSKFKVGDRVRVTPGNDLTDCDGYGTVVKGQGDGNGWYSVKLDRDGRTWSVDGSRLTLLAESSEPQKPIDLDAIQVGDEVWLRSTVLDTGDSSVKVRICGEDTWEWFKKLAVAAHIPKPPIPPATLAEFKAMPEALQLRVYAELVKKGGTA